MPSRNHQVHLINYRNLEHWDALRPLSNARYTNHNNADVNQEILRGVMRLGDGALIIPSRMERVPRRGRGPNYAAERQTSLADDGSDQDFDYDQDDGDPHVQRDLVNEEHRYLDGSGDEAEKGCWQEVGDSNAARNPETPVQPSSSRGASVLLSSSQKHSASTATTHDSTTTQALQQIAAQAGVQGRSLAARLIPSVTPEPLNLGPPAPLTAEQGTMMHMAARATVMTPLFRLIPTELSSTPEPQPRTSPSVSSASTHGTLDRHLSKLAGAESQQPPDPPSSHHSIQEALERSLAQHLDELEAQQTSRPSSSSSSSSRRSKRSRRNSDPGPGSGSSSTPRKRLRLSEVPHYIERRPPQELVDEEIHEEQEEQQQQRPVLGSPFQYRPSRPQAVEPYSPGFQIYEDEDARQPPGPPAGFQDRRSAESRASPSETSSDRWARESPEAFQREVEWRRASFGRASPVAGPKKRMNLFGYRGPQPSPTMPRTPVPVGESPESTSMPHNEGWWPEFMDSASPRHTPGMPGDTPPPPAQDEQSSGRRTRSSPARTPFRIWSSPPVADDAVGRHTTAAPGASPTHPIELSSPNPSSNSNSTSEPSSTPSRPPIAPGPAPTNFRGTRRRPRHPPRHAQLPPRSVPQPQQHASTPPSVRAAGRPRKIAHIAAPEVQQRDPPSRAQTPGVSRGLARADAMAAAGAARDDGAAPSSGGEKRRRNLRSAQGGGHGSGPSLADEWFGGSTPPSGSSV